MRKSYIAMYEFPGDTFETWLDNCGGLIRLWGLMSLSTIFQFISL